MLPLSGHFIVKQQKSWNISHFFNKPIKCCIIQDEDTWKVIFLNYISYKHTSIYSVLSRWVQTKGNISCYSQGSRAEFKERTFHQHLNSQPSGVCTTFHFAPSQLTLYCSLGAFCTNAHVVLTLSGLLDDKGPGWVGLLHSRTDLAVPDTHGRLWKSVAQLQGHTGKGIISLTVSLPESLRLTLFAQQEIKSTYKEKYLRAGMFVYLVKCSREKNPHLLHPVGSTEGPAAITLQKDTMKKECIIFSGVCSSWTK